MTINPLDLESHIINRFLKIDDSPEVKRRIKWINNHLDVLKLKKSVSTDSIHISLSADVYKISQCGVAKIVSFQSSFSSKAVDDKTVGLKNADIGIYKLATIEVYQIKIASSAKLTRRAIKANELSEKTLQAFQESLTAGQTFNLYELNYFQNLPKTPATPYGRYLNHITEYLAEAEKDEAILAGSVIPQGTEFAHITFSKSSIMLSEKLRVSSGGCLGQAVYTTRLVIDAHQERMKNHGASLYNRHSSGSKDVFVIQSAQKGNTQTNWIDRFRMGNVMLQSREETNVKYKRLLDIASKDAYKKYEGIKLLARYIDLLSCRVEETDYSLTALRSDFNYLLKKFEEARLVAPQFLNNILFEILKDYVLIFDGKQEFQEWDMKRHYDLVFDLVPGLRDSFSVDDFNPSMDVVLNKLAKHKYILEERQLDHFKKVFH